MNPIEKIEINMEYFTNKEKLLAVYILENPTEIIRMSADDIAKEAKSSKSAFIRMCQKIGYNGFSEFKFDLSNYLISNYKNLDKEDKNHNSIDIITEQYAKHILAIKTSISMRELSTLVELINTSNKVKIFGSNRTSLSARQLRMRAAKIGFDCEAIDDTALMTDIANILTNKDLLIMFSIRSNQPKYGTFIRQVEMNGCKTVLITMAKNSPFHKHFDFIFNLPLISSASSYTFLDDQAIFFVFIEMLLCELAKTKVNSLMPSNN